MPCCQDHDRRMPSEKSDIITDNSFHDGNILGMQNGGVPLTFAEALPWKKSRRTRTGSDLLRPAGASARAACLTKSKSLTPCGACTATW